ncbi:FxsC protein [Streptomyces geranii]|uniref:FxsC protein n=1 Tax=Streptomyces geranii TaxID=2058923 RepID=UPI000D024FD8|nr:FxsC protein [Streptomyces geranii]
MVQEPYFFLSYARKDDRDEFVKRFYDDLALELRDIGADPAAQPPFRDVERLGLGSDWARVLGGAVGHCRAFVALYSPSYLSSEYCGKEWTAFRERLDKYRQETEIDVPALVPVLWVPMEGELPDGIGRYQYNEAGMGQEYATHGLMHILRTDPTGPVYRRVVERVAARVRVAADRFRLPLTPGLDLTEVRGLFPAAEQPRTAEPGTGHVQVFLAAGVADPLPEGRRRTEYYGRSPREWTPYHPPKYPTVAHRAQKVIVEEGYTSNIEVVDAGLSGRLDETMGNNQTSILLVDPWAVRSEAYRDALAEYDGEYRPATGVLVPCHDADEESGDDAIWQDLSQVLWRNWRRRNDPHDELFRVRVDAEDFDDRLAVMLAVAQNRLMEMETTTPFRLPEGPPPPPLHGLTVPGPGPSAPQEPPPERLRDFDRHDPDDPEEPGGPPAPRY